LWSLYWTDGKGVLHGTVFSTEKPIPKVEVVDGLHNLIDVRSGVVVGVQGKDRDDSEFDDHFHWGDL